MNHEERRQTYEQCLIRFKLNTDLLVEVPVDGVQGTGVVFVHSLCQLSALLRLIRIQLRCHGLSLLLVLEVQCAENEVTVITVTVLDQLR